MLTKHLNKGKYRSKAAPSCGSEDAPALMVKKESLEEPQASSAAAGAGEVKEEPADFAADRQWGYGVGMQSLQMLAAAERSEDKAPKPLIDIVKCEPALIQTMDDGLHCSASDSVALAPSAESPTDDVSPRRYESNRSKQTNEMTKRMKQYSCDDCNQKFGSKNDFGRHKSVYFQRTHTKIKSHIKIYKCDLCDNTYKHKSNLYRHRNLHSKRKQWECNVCDRIFYRKSCFNKHVTLHCELVKWKCDVCHTVLYNKRNLNTLTVHCTVCGTRNAVASSS